MSEHDDNQKRLILHLLNELGEEAYNKLMERLTDVSKLAQNGEIDLVQAFDGLFEEFEISPPPEELVTDETTIAAQIKLLSKYDEIMADPLGCDTLTISSVEYGLRSWLPDTLQRRARDEEESETLLLLNDAYLSGLGAVKAFREEMAMVDDTLLMLSPSLWKNEFKYGIDDDPGIPE